MKKNFIYKIVCAVLCALAIPSVVVAEIADATYLKLIIKVEQLIPGLRDASDEQRDADIKVIQHNLGILKAGTQSARRWRRINKSIIDFDAFMQAQLPARAPRAHVPNPAPRQNIQRINNRQPAPRGLTAEQQLDALLAYTKSLASTADVAFVADQKNNAQAHLTQAVNTIGSMRDILAQHPELAQAFAPRVQAINDRIANMKRSVDLMQ